MPVPLSWKSGLGMNVAVLPCFLATFLTMYLNLSTLSAISHQRLETHVDFGLAAGGHFVVLGFGPDAALHHRQHHFRTNVVQRIGRRHREITFLVAQLVAEVRLLLAAGVPGALDAVDVVVSRVGRLVVADVVEDEEFQFGAEIGRVGNAAWTSCS